MTTNALTLLKLQGIGVPPYSARGVTQSYQVIGEATQLKRTINGALVDLADPLFRKFATTISGGDVDPPIMLWPGADVTMECVAEFAMVDSTDPVFERTPVSGSVRIEAGFIFYRPILTLKVRDINVTRNEYGAATSWTISLEEV